MPVSKMSFINKVHNRLDTLVPASKRNKNISFCIVLLGACLDNMNVSGSLATFNSIQTHFGADTPTSTWALSAYALTLGAFIMFGGKLTDVLGPKKVFLTGLGMSSLMTLICATVENQIIVFIIFRAFQGIFASATIPSMFPIAYSYYASSGMATSLLAILTVLISSSGVGIVIGGAFAMTDIGYKGFYFFSFGVSFVVTIVLYFYMYPVDIHAENKDVSLKNLDFPGSMMIIVGLLLIILGLTEGGESWKKPSAYVPIPVGFLVLVFGAWFELFYIQSYKDKVDQQIAAHSKEKSEECSETTFVKKDWRYNILLLIPREAFSIVNFVPLISAMLLCYVTFLGVLTSCVQYTLYVEEDTAIMAGVKALPLTVGMVIGVFLNSESLIYRINMKWIIITSQAANVFLTLWMAYRNHHVKNNYWIFTFVPLSLYGFLTNTFFGVYFNAILRNTPGHLQGAVSGLLQTAGQVGLCLGNALMATLQGVMTLNGTEEQKDEYESRFRRSFLVLVGIYAAQVLIMLFVKNQKAVENVEPAGTEETPSDEQTSVQA